MLTRVNFFLEVACALWRRRARAGRGALALSRFVSSQLRPRPRAPARACYRRSGYRRKPWRPPTDPRGVEHAGGRAVPRLGLREKLGVREGKWIITSHVPPERRDLPARCVWTDSGSNYRLGKQQHS